MFHKGGKEVCVLHYKETGMFREFEICDIADKEGNLARRGVYLALPSPSLPEHFHVFAAGLHHVFQVVQACG
jgi:hypothetical protein